LSNGLRISPIRARPSFNLIERKVITEFRMCRIALVASAGTIIAFLVGLTHAEDTARAPMPAVPQAMTAPPQQTLKERLGDKASDEQRVDNCKVPVERRGTKIRPADCEHRD
jgi:hypothetical protein